MESQASVSRGVAEHPANAPPPDPRPKHTAPDTTTDLSPVAKKSRGKLACYLCAAFCKALGGLARHICRFRCLKCLNAEWKLPQGPNRRSWVYLSNANAAGS
ncbi:hypothetical protein DQ04_16451010 [Trypanosoma grayi]|uniref:hypothetical protein n=1 Tax=Trypanosoma grayi TaxID=71804 RepID=UPI0004F46DA1|nr:hypothetical protein DQ04_16451010 [Trypanosoma grayi]KEG06025.1 hypothetical protein DQ04_16451010 [Trypanosoma grayi]